MGTLRLATVFSGIGAVEQALIKMGKNFEVVFACDNGEIELDIPEEKIFKMIEGRSDLKANEIVKELYRSTNKKNYVKESYFANYESKITDDKWYEDVRFIDGKKYENKVDLFVGGSPCQSFSAIGKRGGLEDARGTLFYNYAKLVEDIKPKVFIYENVVGMMTHDKGKTWKKIQEIFGGLGYHIHTKVLNSLDYGIPQDRKRIFVVGFKDKIDFDFPEPKVLKEGLFYYLEPKVDTKHYLGKKGFEFVTNPKYKNRASVKYIGNASDNIIKTQKANQQFNWNGDFIFEKFDPDKHNKSICDRGYKGEYADTIGFIRQLSHKECLKLMGFGKFDVVVPNVPAYRQIGNSIVVNVLEELIKSIYNSLPGVEYEDNGNC